MAYNPNSAIRAIYDLKGQWNSAVDTDTKNSISQKAQAYYAQLRNNGYGDVADQLAASNYTQAKPIRDKWATMGMTSANEYLYSLGKTYGLSQSDIDSIIKRDSSGKISINGKKVGTPDATVDGISYWKDPTVLRDSFNAYISNSGATRTPDVAVSQENENLFGKYNDEYKYIAESNPFETETGKSILAKYDLAGLQGRDNEAASGAASNGGNIDSYAAANALRQQSSLISQGQMVALDAHQKRIDNARAILSDMGVNIDRVFNQNETALNNDVARKSETASVTGYVPTEWSIQNDAFLKNFVDENGALKAEYQSVDFQDLINKAKAKGDTELANKYAILRGLKIFGNFAKYGQYLKDGDVAYITPQRTAEYDLTNKQIESAERISSNDNSTDLAIANKNADAELAIANKNAATSLTLADKQAAASIAAAGAAADSSAFGDGQIDGLLSVFRSDDVGPRKFITEKLAGKSFTPETIMTEISKYAAKYNIDVEDARILARAYGVSESEINSWLSGYRDSTADDTGGIYGGMIPKSTNPTN